METERLILRKPKLEDIDNIEKIRNSEFVLKYNGMKKLNRVAMTKMLCEEIQGDETLYIELKSTGTVIGAVFFTEDDLRYKIKSYTLSYYLGEEFGRKGFMAEALSKVIEYLFKEKGAEVVAARVFSKNTASLMLLQKLGFTHEGTLRNAVLGYGDIVYDDMVFSLLKSEYIK